MTTDQNPQPPYDPRPYDQQAYPPQNYPQYGPAPYPPQRSRPLGVTILAILEIIGGIFMLIAAFAMFAVGAVIDNQQFIDQLGTDVPQWFLDLGPTIFLGIGLVLLIMAIVAFILAWGFLKGKRWAWFLGVIFAVLNIISGVVSLISGTPTGILSIAIPVIILIYLMMASTKAWFNR